MAAKKTPLIEQYRHTAALLWGEHQEGRRGPRPSLTPHRIAESAIEIADAKGMDAVSMQAVATEFDFTTMSLYRYIPSKEVLVNLMVDIALGTPPALDKGDWRQRLSDWASATVARYTRHHWLLGAATARRRIMGPHELQWLEAALAALSTTSLDPIQRRESFLLINGHVRNVAHQRLLETDENDAWGTATAELLRDRTAQYTHLVATIEQGGFQPTDEFDYGLRCILDGIEKRMDAAPISPPENEHQPEP